MGIIFIKYFLFGIVLVIDQRHIVKGYPKSNLDTAQASAEAQSIGDGASTVAVASADVDLDLKASETLGFGYYPSFYGGGSLHDVGYGGYGYGSRWGYGGYHGYGGYGGYGAYGNGYYRRPIYPVWG
ncbi:chorion class B protein M3A5 [Ceratitis capitata]|uniref:(Mediterranean fruit fly) hypothetical protein n=1 Tax=Ceratitis capitata TaxID=7213 RepID=W8CD58_CERCA|nr:chorion class B protein M3A5 [Ceratitis capitata]CAD7014779.1 unnamed protein product [Ceratitis capitata]